MDDYFIIDLFSKGYVNLLKSMIGNDITFVFYRDFDDEKFNLKISYLKVRFISKDNIEAKVLVVHGFVIMLNYLKI